MKDVDVILLLIVLVTLVQRYLFIIRIRLFNNENIEVVIIDLFMHLLFVDLMGLLLKIVEMIFDNR